MFGAYFSRVITADVLRLQLVENVRITDDRETIRAARVGGFKQSPARAAARIVLSHVHLAADHVHLLGQFIRRQRRVLHDVAQDVNRRARAGVRHVNVIHRAVEARVGVHVTAGFLHLLVNPAAGPRGGAFEQHVLQHVRQSRAEPAPSWMLPAIAHACADTTGALWSSRTMMTRPLSSVVSLTPGGSAAMSLADECEII